MFYIHSIKKRSEESSKNVCSANLENSLGKEELYLRKIKKNMLVNSVAKKKCYFYNIDMNCEKY
jgi:hypothetical protein